MHKIDVKLKNNPYSILIENNILEKSGELINSILPSEKYGVVFILTDKNIEKFCYLKVLNNSLKKAGYKYFNIILDSGEKTKCFDVYEKTANYILQNGISRKDFLIALGGGVIGDLTGFLASTILRGVPFVQIPTTLLSQVDSSVGGKNGIDTKFGKNLIGTFYQPRLVLIDPLTLKTLSKRDLKAGYTEALKYGLIMNKTFFNYLKNNGVNCINLDLDVCKYVIFKCCKFKASIVEKDEFETKGLRTILNFGHTFGHVYEVIANFDVDKIIHGEAVGLGIIQASILSKNLGFCTEKDLDTIINHFKLLKLFSFEDLKKLKEFKNINVENFMSIMKKDKKSNYDQLNLILLHKIGEAKLQKDVSKNEVIKVISQTI